MSSRIRYHLVDRLNKVDGSRRYIKTFNSFQELKDFLNYNRVELYKAVPEPEKNAPDFSDVRGFMDLVKKLESNEYMGWHLSAVQTINKESTVNRLKGNKRWNYTKELGKGSRRRGHNNKSGVNESYLDMLSKREQNIFKESRLFRVLHYTNGAILVEWTGSRGSFSGWIPKHFLW